MRAAKGGPTSIYTIMLATSTDGHSWARANGNRSVFRPGPAGSFDSKDVLHPSVVRTADGNLHMFYNGVGDGNADRYFHVGHASSKDGTLAQMYRNERVRICNARKRWVHNHLRRCIAKNVYVLQRTKTVGATLLCET